MNTSPTYFEILQWRLLRLNKTIIGFLPLASFENMIYNSNEYQSFMRMDSILCFPKLPRYIKYIDCIRFMDYEYYLIPVTNGGCDVP